MTVEIGSVDVVRVTQIVEDHAGRWYGQVGPFTFGKSDCARYLTEGPLSKLCERRGWNWRELWTWVAGYLDEHPHLLDVRYTDREIRDRQEARQAAASELEARASAAYYAGEFGRALELLDEAEMVVPDGYRQTPGALLVTWESLRELVREGLAAQT